MNLEHRLLKTPTLQQCARVLNEAEIPPTEDLVYRLCAEARQRMRVNLTDAIAYSAAAYAVARYLKSPKSLAESLKMRGHVAYLGGKYRQAAKAYEKAIEILEKLGDEVEAGRTLSSALQTLIYLGRYDAALAWGDRARDIFERHTDQLRLARLDANIANVLHRQDRLQEALAKYESAISEFRRLGDRDSIAIALRNLAVCRADRHDLDGALGAYNEAREHSDALGLTLLTAEIDDNIAYLYYLTGDYIRAIALYQAGAKRERSNTHQTAVSLLDQSELYLDINLLPEAAETAKNASELFAKLKMHYEHGKALVNYSLALSGMNATAESLKVLSRARRLFFRDHADAWVALTDLYCASVLRNKGDIESASKLASTALSALETSQLDTRKAAAALFLAETELFTGNADLAKSYCNRARAWLAAGASYSLQFLLATIEARIAEAAGQLEAAKTEYSRARELVESARGRLVFDRLSFGFLKNREGVYHALVRLSLQEENPALALRYVEEAKSRSLADLMTVRAGGQKSTLQTPDYESVQALRNQLSWFYRQQDRLELARDQSSNKKLTEIREQIQAYERRLTHAVTVSLQVGSEMRPAIRTSEFSIVDAQEDLDRDAAILEYFESSGRIYVAVITINGFTVRPMCSVSEVNATFRFIVLQLSRGHSGRLRPSPDDSQWLAATQSHLQKLYELLISSVHHLLPTGHLVIVPYGPLHSIPFHVLHDGEKYMVERRTISIAPSSTIQRLCDQRQDLPIGRKVVFGFADERTPFIAEECQTVTRVLGGSELFFGSDATPERFAEVCSAAGILHIASHGVHRRDNPAFSYISLAGDRLCLHDLHRFEMNAQLVTLSGCATGRHHIIAGDEAMGLARGFLAAGASAVHVSLWDVDDRATAMYMTEFYSALRSGSSIAAAARSAMLTVSREYPHPYFWAPFYVTGRTNIALPYISGCS